MEGNIIFRHGKPIEVLHAFRKLISVAMFRQQTNSLLVKDLIRRVQVKLILDRLVQAFFKRQAIRINPVPIFLRKYKVEANKPLQLLGEVNSFRKAKDRKQGVVDFIFFRIFLEQYGFKGLLKEALH